MKNKLELEIPATKRKHAIRGKIKKIWIFIFIIIIIAPKCYSNIQQNINNNHQDNNSNEYLQKIVKEIKKTLPWSSEGVTLTNVTGLNNTMTLYFSLSTSNKKVIEAMELSKNSSLGNMKDAFIIPAKKGITCILKIYNSNNQLIITRSFGPKDLRD